MITQQEIHNASILIVDDQDANVQMLEQLLAGAGYTHVSSTLQSQPYVTCTSKTPTTPVQTIL